MVFFLPGFNVPRRVLNPTIASAESGEAIGRLEDLADGSLQKNAKGIKL